jgi:cytochrome b561
MRLALRTVRLVQIAMLVAVGVYIAVGEVVRTHFTATPSLLYAASVASIGVVGSLLVVRRTMVLHSETQLREKPDDPSLLARWRAGHIVTYALCEVLALFGLTLRLVGFSISDVWPYYAGSLVLLLLFWPKLPRTDPA